MKNSFQLNKLSNLHDGKNIVFCKTDFIKQEFDYIKNINNDVILVTGNSDYPITDDIVNLVPKNVVKWYAQNALSNYDLIEPIPLGIENKLPSVRQNHGIGYFDRVSEKEVLLNRKIEKYPDKFIYANFNINTNFEERIKYKNISIQSNHIDWSENNLSLESFFDKIKEYQMILCPIGNGIDTHRLWEVLYSDRIPITVKVGNFKIYTLYEKLPIIILNDINELLDYDLIISKFHHIKNKNFEKKILDVNYWINEIKSNLNK